MAKSMHETMKELNVRTCPICGKEYTGHPALSRKDNKTEICPYCGTLEALDVYMEATCKGDKKLNNKYCIFEDKLCRYANRWGDHFTCEAPSDESLKFICK